MTKEYLQKTLAEWLTIEVVTSSTPGKKKILKIFGKSLYKWAIPCLFCLSLVFSNTNTIFTTNKYEI